MRSTVGDELALLGLSVGGVHVKALFLCATDVERLCAIRLAALDTGAVSDLANGAFLTTKGRRTDQEIIMQKNREARKREANQAPSSRVDVFDPDNVLIQVVIRKGQLRDPQSTAYVTPLKGLGHFEAASVHWTEDTTLKAQVIQS